MKTTNLFLVGAMACAVALQTHAVTIQVTPWSAPNAFGSPSFAGAVDNAIYAQRHGLTSYGDPSSPTYYQAAPTQMQLKDNIVTGYPSWKGDADPVGSYGPAYGAELGNRLHFGVLVLAGIGSKVEIGLLGFSATSTDGGTLNFGFGVGSYNYSAQYVGWNFGGDNTPNTGDDTFITGGPNNQQVDAIVGRGSGNAWASYLTDPGATPQDKLDGVVASIQQTPFDFTGTYTYGDASGSATVRFNAPDGGSNMMLLAGACGALFLGRKMFAISV